MSPSDSEGSDGSREDGVDVSLIRWMLSLTPAQRLAYLQATVDAANRIRAANS